MLILTIKTRVPASPKVLNHTLLGFPSQKLNGISPPSPSSKYISATMLSSANGTMSRYVRACPHRCIAVPLVVFEPFRNEGILPFPWS